jgi:cytochrome P450
MHHNPSRTLLKDTHIHIYRSLTFAAFDTTSSAISRIIHLLSRNLDAQDKLRAEITDAFHNGDLAHDDLVNLPYLDAVCRETMRV